MGPSEQPPPKTTKEISRRQLLLAGGSVSIVSIAALLVLNDGVNKSSSTIVTPQEFGAIADGRHDCTQALNAALASGSPVFIPRIDTGVYLIKDTLVIGGARALITLEQGVVIRAATSAVMIVAGENLTEVAVKGNGATLDLNGLSTCGISLDAATSSLGNPDSGVVVNDLVVANNTDLKTVSSAVEVRGCANVSLDRVVVKDFGTKAAKDLDLQVYGIGFFFCENARAEHCEVLRGSIGFEIQRCSGVRLSDCHVSDLSDNGVYILAGSTMVEINRCRIVRAEEGIAILSEGVKVLDSTFLDCTNKGISLRNASLAMIESCVFDGNVVHIGDDGSLRPSANVQITASTFAAAGERSIYLRQLRSSTIDENMFDSPSNGTDTHVRLTNADGVDITANTFSGPDTISVRLSGSSSDCKVRHNHIKSASIGVAIDSEPGSVNDAQVSDNKFDDGVRRQIDK